MYPPSTIEIAFTVPGQAVPWARAGMHGKVKYTPQKQLSFMGVVRMFAAREMARAGLLKPIDGPVSMSVIAIYAWPKSWSDKRKLQPGAIWKTSRPDGDNIYKLAADSCNKIVYSDDAKIAAHNVQKRYGDTPGLHVTVRTLGAA